MNRLTVLHELRCKVSALSARSECVSNNPEPALECSKSPASISIGVDSLVDAIGMIASSPLRVALWMSIIFEMNARTIASLSWCETSVDASWNEGPHRKNTRIFPLPLIVAAFLHEGDRPNAIDADELEYRLQVFEKSWSITELRRRIYAVCAIGDLRATSLAQTGLTSSFSATRRSVARLDIGLLLHLKEPPRSLQASRDLLSALPIASAAVRRLMLRQLAEAHLWAEDDVLTVTLLGGRDRFMELR